MKNQTREDKFAQFFLLTTDAKMTMGILFAFFAFMYLSFGLISPSATKYLDFFTALQMMIATFFIGVAEQIFLHAGEKLTKLRGFLLIFSGTLITLIFSIVFEWFAGFPLWCPIVFISFTAMGIGFILYACYLELKRETKRLNEKLEQFKNRKN